MIAPDDARHGTRAGYIAGCRTDCCRVPHWRYQKRSRLRLQREGTQVISAHRVLARALWWRARGVSLKALGDAADVGVGTLNELMTGHRDVCLRATERAILAVTWDDLPDTGLCYADLTRLRIHSLMAAGHPLEWICGHVGPGLPVRGRWRHQERVTVGTARRVLHVYTHAPLAGPSRATATKARNRGHQHPLAWDDPEVPSMPQGWSPFLEQGRVSGPTRIQRRRTPGWRMPDTAIYVGRPGRWGNPFAIGALHPDHPRPIADATEAVHLYQHALTADQITYWDPGHRARRPITPGLIRQHLAGHDLACWCPIDQPCHADVLLELANQETP